MATIALMPIEVKGSVTGSAPEMETFPEAATQSFKKGELVILASGKVTVAGANPTGILGVAAHDASGITDNPVNVYIANLDTIFVANLSTGIASAITQVGARFGVTKVGTNWHVDTAKTGATERVVVKKLDSRDAVGDTQGRVHVVFLGDKTLMGQTASSA